MAIFLPGAGYTQPIVLTGMNLHSGAQGQPVIGAATTNRMTTRSLTQPQLKAGISQASPDAGSQSITFEDIDQTINWLDALYELLYGPGAP